MTCSQSNIAVRVDLTNPGQFFACCGLLELADRLWPGAEGCFDREGFCIWTAGSLGELIDTITRAALYPLDPNDELSSPIRVGEPFELTLDWWTNKLTGGKQLKVWAGSMRGLRIARAMQQAIAGAPHTDRIFDYGVVVHDPDNPRKKVEPYYFDSRRGSNARALDIGFACDSVKMTTPAFPAVEFLCLAGLQRFRPATTDQRRVFKYFPWHQPLPTIIAAAAASGAISYASADGYRFENAFRTDQKKHKSFLPATLIGAEL
jgi:CRISPR-associated protein Csb3